jgi:hypothetical protein
MMMMTNYDVKIKITGVIFIFCFCNIIFVEYLFEEPVWCVYSAEGA